MSHFALTFHNGHSSREILFFSAGLSKCLLGSATPYLRTDWAINYLRWNHFRTQYFFFFSSEFDCVHRLYVYLSKSHNRWYRFRVRIIYLFNTYSSGQPKNRFKVSMISSHFHTNHICGSRRREILKIYFGRDTIPIIAWPYEWLIYVRRELDGYQHRKWCRKNIMYSTLSDNNGGWYSPMGRNRKDMKLFGSRYSLKLHK